jgi:hypothetical protein
MSKIITLFLALTLALGLISCNEPEKKQEELPPVVTVGLPENEKLTTSYEADGFVVNLYESYSEIAEYRGKETVVTVPDAFMGLSVKSIYEYAFFGNEAITKVTLPDSVIVIGKSAFQDCTALTEVVLGNGLEVISQAAFRDSALEKINLPDSVAEMGRYAFYRTRIAEIKLPSSLSTVPKYAFYGCERLTKIEFCPRVEWISEYAFSSCTALTSVVITDRVELISDYAFSECKALAKIFIPKKTALGENPFHNSDKLTIYSPSGSKAESNAKKYGYSFKECASMSKMP